MIAMSDILYLIKIHNMFWVAGNQITPRIDRAFTTDSLRTALNALVYVNKYKNNIYTYHPEIVDYPAEIIRCSSLSLNIDNSITGLEYSISDLLKFVYCLTLIMINSNQLIAHFTDMRHKEDRVSGDLLHALEFDDVNESLVSDLRLFRKKRRQAKDNVQALLLLRRHIKYTNSDVIPRLKERNINIDSDINNFLDDLLNVNYCQFGFRLAEIVIIMRSIKTDTSSTEETELMALLINAVDDPEGLLNDFYNAFDKRSYSPREPKETGKYFN